MCPLTPPPQLYWQREVVASERPGLSLHSCSHSHAAHPDDLSRGRDSDLQIPSRHVLQVQALHSLPQPVRAEGLWKGSCQASEEQEAPSLQRQEQQIQQPWVRKRLLKGDSECYSLAALDNVSNIKRRSQVTAWCSDCSRFQFLLLTWVKGSHSQKSIRLQQLRSDKRMRSTELEVVTPEFSLRGEAHPGEWREILGLVQLGRQRKAKLLRWHSPFVRSHSLTLREKNTDLPSPLS